MAAIYLNQLPPSREGETIGLFGGSFNPPHEGHLWVAQQALKYLNLSKIWWMVSPGNPNKNNSALPKLEARVLLSEKLLENEDKIIITSFEEQLPSRYSFDSISYILQHSKAKFIWLMGGDSLADFHLWHRFRDIAQMIAIAVIQRAGTINPQLTSCFSKEYAAWQVQDPAKLVWTKPPAWCYIEGKTVNQSSTNLRKAKESSIMNIKQLIIENLSKHKAEDIVSFNISATSLASDVIIATGNSGPHVRSLSEYLLIALKEAGVKNIKIEGLEDSGWVLMDIGDEIVHIFSEEMRRFYDLEGIFGHFSAKTTHA